MVSMARSTALFSGIPTEKCAPAACTARTTFERQYAESARTRIGPHAPARRAVAMVSRSIRTAPVAECAAPRRNRVAAITGAACAVLIVASWALSPGSWCSRTALLLTRAVDGLDGVINVDHRALIQPGQQPGLLDPAQQCPAGHRVQLPDMTEREPRRNVPSVDGALIPVNSRPVAP